MIIGLQGNWCEAKPGTSDDQLQQNINFACNQVDCSPTHSGGACFNPATLINHASYAMNLYYQTTGKKKSSCDFRETGLLVSNDPSKLSHFIQEFYLKMGIVLQLCFELGFWILLQLMVTAPTNVTQRSEKLQSTFSVVLTIKQEDYMFFPLSLNQ